VQVYPERVHKVDALASTVHHLVERIAVATPEGEKSVWVTVTNVYHKTPQGWRMVAHHASPSTSEGGGDSIGQTMVLH